MLPDVDLRIDTYTNSSPNIHMRIMHIPTGCWVQGDTVLGGRARLKARLLDELEAKVARDTPSIPPHLL